MTRPDITVMGAGIFGLSVAWCCLKKGAAVQVIDPGGPGAGASGGVVGALAPHVPENWNAKKAFQLDSLLMAESFWDEVAATSGISPGYARAGRLQPGDGRGGPVRDPASVAARAEAWLMAFDVGEVLHREGNAVQRPERDAARGGGIGDVGLGAGAFGEDLDEGMKSRVLRVDAVQTLLDKRARRLRALAQGCRKLLQVHVHCVALPRRFPWGLCRVEGTNPNPLDPFP